MKTRVAMQKKKLADVFLTLSVLYAVAAVLYGPRVLIMLVIAYLSAFLADKIFLLAFGLGKREKYDYSSYITAMIITILLPAAAPYWIIPAGVFIALLLGKYCFGGAGINIFNPAAVGLGFLGLCWPDLVFRYTKPFERLPLRLNPETLTDVSFHNSLLHTLKNDGRPYVGYMEAILGNFAGPMGAGIMAVLVACGIFLILRKTIPFEIPAAMFVTSSLFALIVQRVNTGPLDSLVYETIAGVLVFGSIFIATDPALIPVTNKGRVLFGLMLGFFAMLFRYYGKTEFGFVYAMLIVNALTGFCDDYADSLYKKIWKFIKTIVRITVKTLIWLGRHIKRLTLLTVKKISEKINDIRKKDGDKSDGQTDQEEL